MAGSKIALFVAAAVVSFIAAGATDFIVGDEAGWNVGVNYTKWAAGKEFRVGDKLVFRYKAPNHDVIRVNGAEFGDCTIPPNAVPQTTGNDTITLTTSGRKWYICGIENHCKSGMKLFINVNAEYEAPAPSPSEGGNGEGNSASSVAGSYLISAVAAFVAMLVMH